MGYAKTPCGQFKLFTKKEKKSTNANTHTQLLPVSKLTQLPWQKTLYNATVAGLEKQAAEQTKPGKSGLACTARKHLRL